MDKNSEQTFSSIKDFYDNEYYKGDQEPHPLPWHCRLIARRLGGLEEKKVLDVACGTGAWLQFFHTRGAKIAGIDLSSKAISQCVKNFPDGDFHCGPAEKLPFPDAHFDLVTCLGSLEHFVDKTGALAEMRRVAKSDAQFLILVPNSDFLTRKIGLYHGTHQVTAKEDVLSLDEWEKLFHAADLSILARWPDLHPMSCSWIKSGKWFSWPIRAIQALALATWPLRWQYQVYFYCRAANAN